MAFYHIYIKKNDTGRTQLQHLRQRITHNCSNILDIEDLYKRSFGNHNFYRL